MKRLLRAMGRALVPILALLAVTMGLILISSLLLLLAKTTATLAILIAVLIVMFIGFTIIEYKYDRRQ